MDYLAPLPPSSVAGCLSFSILIEMTIYLAPEEVEEETPDWPWGGEKLEGTAQKAPPLFSFSSTSLVPPPQPEASP